VLASGAMVRLERTLERVSQVVRLSQSPAAHRLERLLMGKAAVLAPSAWSLEVQPLERVQLVRVLDPPPAHWLGLGPLAAVLASDAMVRLERTLERVRKNVSLSAQVMLLTNAQSLLDPHRPHAAVLAPSAIQPVENV